jgi:hypothetical protein
MNIQVMVRELIIVHGGVVAVTIYLELINVSNVLLDIILLVDHELHHLVSVELIVREQIM